MSPIVVFANGQARQIPAKTTLRDWVASLGLPEGAVMIELNGEVAARSDWENRCLEHGDRIEVFRVVAGG